MKMPKRARKPSHAPFVGRALRGKTRTERPLPRSYEEIFAIALSQNPRARAFARARRPLPLRLVLQP